MTTAGIADVYATVVATLGRSWREEFLAAIARPGAGTGYVEALNRQLKRMHGEARGNACFALLRTRMLYAHGRPETRALIIRLAEAVVVDLAAADTTGRQQ